MHVSASRSVVIISGLLTMLPLSGGTLALALHNGWLRTASDTTSRETVAASAQPRHTGNGGEAAVALPQLSSAAPMQGGTQGEVGDYRQRTEEAYQALDDAYAQIRALQSPESQLAFARDDDRFAKHEGDDDRRERRSGRRESHDE